MLEGTNAEGLNEKKKRVAGEAASAERSNKSDSFDSWVMATEGETGGEKREEKQAGGVAQAEAVGSGLV